MKTFICFFWGFVCLVGCAPDPVAVELNFPSERAFLYADQARLLVYPVDPETNLDSCPQLLSQLRAGVDGDPVWDSGNEGVCTFRAGQVGFDELPSGPLAFVVDVTSTVETNGSFTSHLFMGCRIAEVYPDASSIRIELFPSVDFPTTDPPVSSVSAKCN